MMGMSRIKITDVAKRNALAVLFILPAFLLALGTGPDVTSSANAQTPQYGQDLHIGVTSCAGSTCHGATSPWENSTVLQNEYVTWSQKDEHSKAYSKLLNEESKRIAANLGLPNAHEADLCLD